MESAVDVDVEADLDEDTDVVFKDPAQFSCRAHKCVKQTTFARVFCCQALLVYYMDIIYTMLFVSILVLLIIKFGLIIYVQSQSI